MHRFIALHWRAAEAERRAVATELADRIRTRHPSWGCGFESDGLLVFHSATQNRASRIYPLEDGAGLVIGSLFRSGQATGPVDDRALGDGETRLVLESGGHHLVTRYWGRYVAFLVDKERRTVRVVRGPCSALPCFTFRFHGIDIVFSRLEDVCSLDCISFSVNWSYIASHLLFDQLISRTTGLEGVGEVLPGECVEIDGGVSARTFLWHPAPFCRDPGLEDSGDAARLLRKTTRACVSAWASSYDRIILELSGGLDSSIVLACLAKAPRRPEITCVNIFTEEAKGDERTLARIAAKSAGCRLVEVPIRPSETTLRHMLTVPRIPRPHISAIGLMFEDAYMSPAKEHGAEAFFTGQGGDHLFHQRRTALVAADYLRRHGLGPGLARVIAETARATRIPVWRLLRTALIAGAFRRSSKALVDLDRAASFLDPGILGSIQEENLLHPWFESCSDVAPAKLAHLADLVNLQSYHVPFGRAEIADSVFPLFSQPLVEFCLRIPCYVLTEGGRDRALARRAFAGSVAGRIIDRETKGDITHFYNAVVSREIDFVRELLLDGMLARERLIDRKRLEWHLGDERIVRGDQIAQILVYAGVEVWARRWAEDRARVTA